EAERERWARNKSGQRSAGDKTVNVSSNSPSCPHDVPIDVPGMSPPSSFPFPIPLEQHHKKRGDVGRASALPSEFHHDASHERLAAELGLDLDTQLVAFVTITGPRARCSRTGPPHFGHGSETPQSSRPVEETMPNQSLTKTAATPQSRLSGSKL